MLWKVGEQTWAGVSNGLQDLAGISMAGTIGFIAFFPKGAIIEENQNGIGLGQITCAYYGKFSLVLD